jgi:hypothetical protein
MTKARKTAAELAGDLKTDRKFFTDEAKRTAERLRRRELLREASIPLVADLREMGFDIHSIAELMNGEYRDAIPILGKWLVATTNLDLKEVIVRALSVPQARPLVRLLIQEFRNENVPAVKWAIANALSIVADDDVFDDIYELAQDRRHGKSREMIVLALGNMADTRARCLLLDLLDDETVAGHAIKALGRNGRPEDSSKIAPFLRHSKSWVRQESRRTLDKIRKKPDRHH